MSAAPAVLAAAGGSLIFLIFMIVFFFAIVFGFYTRRGSAINKHPNDGKDGAPGSSDPSEVAGQSRGHESNPQGGGTGRDSISTHGTG